MATKTFYVLGTAAPSPNFFGQLQDGGSAPTAANATYGWKVAKISTATPFWKAFLGASATATTASASDQISSATGPTKGTGATATTAGDSFVTALPYTANITAGTWTLAFGMRCTTSSSQAGHINVRVWASKNADGSSARELTSGSQVCSTITLSSTTATFNSTVSWSAPAITLNNEYLFFQVEWVETVASGSNNGDVVFYISACSIVTGTWTDFIAGTLSSTEGGDTSAITGLANAFGTAAATEAGDTAAIAGSSSLIQGVYANTSASSVTNQTTPAFPNPNTPGNTIIVFVAIGTSGSGPTNTINSVTDTAGNTYSPVDNGYNDTAGDSYTQIWYAANIKAQTGNQVTAHFTAQPYPDVQAFECANIAAANPVDIATGAGAATAGTSVSTGSMTTTLQDLIFFAVAPKGNAAVTFAGSYVKRDLGDPWGNAVGEQIVAAGSISGSATLASAQNWTAALVAFKRTGPTTGTLAATEGGDTAASSGSVSTGGSITLGDPAQGPSSGGFSGITAVKATLSQSGTLQSISIWLYTGTAVGVSYLLGIYDATASGGLAGNLIATTAVQQSVAGLVTIPTTTNPVLAPGDYWIAIQNDAGGLSACYLNPAPGGNVGEWYNPQGWTGALANPFPSASASTGPYQFSLYATLSGGTAVTGTMSATEGTVFNTAYTPVGASNGPMQPIYAQELTLSQQALITSISFYGSLSSGANPVHFLAGLYTNSPGSPDTPLSLLVQSAVTAVTLGADTAHAAWFTIPFPPTLLAPGTYWIAHEINTGEGMVAGFYDSGISGGNLYYASLSWTGSMPTTFPAGGTTLTGYGFSFYASGANAGDGCAGSGTVSSGVSGSLAATEAGDTAAVSGVVKWVATLAVTEAGDVSAITGTVDWKGTLAVTEIGDTASSTGVVDWKGTLAATESGDTAASAGGIYGTGTLASTEANDTASISGTIATPAVTGTLSATEAGDTAASPGVVDWKGTLAATDAGDSAAISGGIYATGTLAATEAQDTMSAAGAGLAISGALSVTETGDAAAIAGLAGVLGPLAVTDGSDTASCTGTVRWIATLAATEASDAAVMTGLASAFGTLSVTESPDASSSTGSVYWQAALTATEAGDTAAVLAFANAFGTLSATEAPDTMSAGGAGLAISGPLIATETGDAAAADGVVRRRGAAALLVGV